MKVTVFIADDHAIVRDGLRLLLQSQADLEVVGEAANGREAVAQVPRLRPDIAIVDLSMPELNGIDVIRRLHETCPSTQVIVLSMYSTAEHIYHALQAGARGYLVKECSVVEVIQAVRAVHAGRTYMSQKISDTVVSEYLRQHESSVRSASPVERLSAREREILQFVVEGKSSAEIAELLFLSPKTVETYRSRLMRKLDVGDIPALVKFAILHGLTPLE